MKSNLSRLGITPTNTSNADRPIYEIAEEELRRLVLQVDMEAIKVALKMRPKDLGETC